MDQAPAWNELLSHLADGPRENGTAGLARAALDLVGYLQHAGLTVERVPFTAHPYEIRLLGVFVLAACLVFLYLVRRSRIGAALLISLLIPLVVILTVEFGLPVFGGLGATRQDNIVARIPADFPQQRLIFTAHYDTKTDLVDHVVRTPIQLLGLPICGLMIMASGFAIASRNSSRRDKAKRFLKIVAMAAAVYGILFFLAYSGGAILRARSSGSLDDGAACAVLVRSATVLAQSPPMRHTTVEFIFFSGEELGGEGSNQYVISQFNRSAPLPTYIINFDPVGASRTFAVTGRESRLFRSYRPDPHLVQSMDAVYRELTGSPLTVTSRGGLTDGFAFASRDIPTATIISEVPPFILPRGMHTAKDMRSRIDVPSLDLTEELLLHFVRRIEDQGMNFRRSIHAQKKTAVQ